MPQKISDFFPATTPVDKVSLYQQILPWFDEFQKSRSSVPAQEVGVEMLYMDWLRSAYAYRRMLIQDLCLVAFDIAEVRACIMVRRNEVFRKGFDEWEPRFVVKCENCGKEFQTSTEYCDECFVTEVQFQGYEDEIKINDDGTQEIIKNPIYKTIYSRDENGEKIPSKVRSPDLSQVRRFEEFKKSANGFGQGLEDVLRQAMEFCYIADDGYILRNKEYFFDDNRQTGSRITEVRALHPALVEFDLNKDGLPQKSHWICLEHRNTVRDAPGPCLECGKETLPVMYVYNHRGKKVYLTETELIHFSLASPSLIYGYSLILSILQKALTLSGMDRWLYRYFFERKVPSGIILTYTDDPQSLEVARSRIEAKMQDDPQYIPWIGVSQKTGRGRCVTKDSFIWTSEGLLTMEELYAGNHTSVETKVGMQKILDKVKFEKKPVVKVTLGQNIELKCTPNHPLWTKRGWIDAKYLIDGDYVLSASGRNYFKNIAPQLPQMLSKTQFNQKEFIAPKELTNDMARLIGYYVAEGYFSSDGSKLSIAVKNTDVLQDICNICDSLKVSYTHRIHKYELTIFNALFVRWFKEIVNWCGTGAHRKQLPHIIRCSTRELFLSFLAGYFADGCLHVGNIGRRKHRPYPYFEWDSLSENLIRGIQQILLNIGISAAVYKRKNRANRHHDGSVGSEYYWNLCATGADAVLLAKLVYPHVNFNKDRFSLIFDLHTHLKNSDKRTKIIDKDGSIWLRFKKVEDAGVEDVYDLTVENTHSYVANGLIVHNTDFVRLFHSIQEMDYIPVRSEIRERIAMMFGVPPLWQSDTGGMGGLGSQSRQLEMFSRVVESDQRLLNEKIIPLLLADFGITDWKISVKTPEEKTEEARMSLATQRIQAANVLFTMGFDIDLAANKGGKIDDINFIISGRAQRPEMPMLGLGGMPMGQPTVPEQAGEGETKPIADAGQEVNADIKNLMNKGTNKHLPFGTEFDRAHGLHNATDSHKNNPADRYAELKKEFDGEMNKFKEKDGTETSSESSTSAVL